MELSDSFEVGYPVDTVWEVLTDVERIAPCLPGAQLTGSDGSEHQGLVKVKVGPVTSQYNGKASFTEVDAEAHRLVMDASGRDSRGAGNAAAQITVQLESVGDGATRVSVDTDLKVTGKVAQFGRGVLADVSRKLMGQFAANLADLIASEQDSGAAESDEGVAHGGDVGEADGGGDADGGAGEGVGSEESAASESAGGAGDGERSEAGAPPSPRLSAPQTDDVEAIDLLAVAGGSAIKRYLPHIIVAVVLIILVGRRRCSRRA